MLKWDSDAERDYWAAKCRDSFWWFFLVGWGAHYNPEGTFICDAVHKPLCDWFEAHVKDWLAKRGTKERYRLSLAVLVPRRVGKSTIITQAGLAWLHLLDPNISTFIGSYNTEFAEDFLPPIKAILSGGDPYGRFTWLYGNWYDKERVWKTDQLTHAVRTNTTRRDPSFGTWGVEKGLTGRHPDVLCLDDPTTYEKMGTDFGWLQTVNQHIVSLEPVVESDGIVIWVGTRYSDADHFGHYLRREGIKTLTGMPMPDLTATSGRWHVYFLQARDRAGRPVIPTVWGEQELKDFATQDPVRYASQAMNDPTTSVFSPLTRQQVDALMVDSKGIPLRNLSYTIHMDTAFKSAESQIRGDESVIQLWGHFRDGSGDVVFCGAWSSHLWRIEHFLDKLVQIVRQCRYEGKQIRLMTDEAEIGGKVGSWETVLNSAFNGANVRMPPLILLHRGGKKKLARIIAGASYWIDGHVKLLRDAPGIDNLIGQMTKIGTSAHDDHADCASDVFNKEVYNIMHRPYNQTNEDAEAPAAWDYIIKDAHSARNALARATERLLNGEEM